MRGAGLVLGAAALLAAACTVVRAHEDSHNLPAGPVRDRHELMEGIGKNSKVIGEALKSGNHAPIQVAAEQIQASAAKILGLFPPGSAHEKSRAKPEIWTDWAKFEASAKKLETDAGNLALAAKIKGSVRENANLMFGDCKTCHEAFRVPDKK